MGNSNNKPISEVHSAKLSSSAGGEDAKDVEETIVCDVMISYSHEDKDLTMKLKEELEKNGVSVWIDKSGLTEGGKFFDRIGEAISNAKIVIPIVSEYQVNSKFCIGEVALAYVLECALLPCSIGDKKTLLKKMPGGMRLQLAELDWFNLQDIGTRDVSGFDIAFPKVLERISKLKNNITGPGRPNSAKENTSISRVLSLDDSYAQSLQFEKDFWEENFGDVMEIDWNTFKAALKAKIEKPPFNEYLKSDFEEVAERIYKEFNVQLNDSVKKSEYSKFLMEGGTIHFMLQLRNHWSEICAVKNVFKLDSNMRIKAVEKLANHPSKHVFNALLDLTEDHDPNARAVSIITLAKVVVANKSSNIDVSRGTDRIIVALDDPDRLVRECACLALGNIQNIKQEAIMKIVYIWRNDVIASVRQCAEVALRRFENEEARMAIHMTEILKSEIEKLKT